MKEEEKEKKEREKRPTPAERELPTVIPERTPAKAPPEREVAQGRVEPPRHTRPPTRYGAVYASVAVSLILTFVLMIGALCLISTPDLPTQEEPVAQDTASGEEEGRRVVWVHGVGAPEGAMSTPELYEACRRSVVSVRTHKGESAGIGSGFVLRDDGYVATAAHVVAGSDRVEVVLWDGQSYPAQTVGCDGLTDLALLRIEAEGLFPVSLGSSSELLPGERVVAIGTPASLDYAGSVCSGEVSCALRTVKLYDEESGALEKKMKLIQMSAPVNPGNSGCPLFDAFGRVVGVVTMKLGKQFSGIGFAIPSDGAAEILSAMCTGEELTDELLAAVSLRAASLGTEMEAYEMGGRYGVRVTGFFDPEAPSAKVLAVGDMILSLGKEAVTRASDVERVLQGYAPKESVAVTVLRNGQTLTLDVMLSARQSDEK